MSSLNSACTFLPWGRWLGVSLMCYYVQPQWKIPRVCARARVLSSILISKWVSRFPQLNWNQKKFYRLFFFLFWDKLHAIYYSLRCNINCCAPKTHNLLLSEESKVVERNFVRVYYSGPKHCPVGLKPDKCLRLII